MISLLLAAVMAVPYTEEELRQATSRIWAEMPPEVRKEMFPDVERPRGFDAYVKRRRTRPPELKEKFIPWLKRMAYPLPGYVDHVWEGELFLEGDSETAATFVHTYFEQGDYENYGRLLRDSQNPEVVALIGPYLFDDAAFPKRHHKRPKNWVAELQMLHLIPTCEEFSKPVREWAEQLGEKAEQYAQFGPILREWWKANEAAFRERRYHDVLPGALPATVSSEVAAARPTGEAASGGPAIEPPLRTTTTAPSKHRTGMLIGACGIGLAISSAILLRRRRTAR